MPPIPDFIDWNRPRRRPTPGWHASRGYPFGRTLQTRDGEYLIEYVYQEWKRSEPHGPMSYRYVFAVTMPDDGRRIEFETLGSLTLGEAVARALWSEQNGLATVTGGRVIPEAATASPAPRFRRIGKGR